MLNVLSQESPSITKRFDISDGITIPSFFIVRCWHAFFGVEACFGINFIRLHFRAYILIFHLFIPCAISPTFCPFCWGG